MMKGEFERRIFLTGSFKDLSSLELNRLEMLFDEARKEFPSIKSLQELRGYLVKLYTYFNPMRDGSEIFSQRHFLSKIDKLIETQKKWFGEQND